MGGGIFLPLWFQLLGAGSPPTYQAGDHPTVRVTPRDKAVRVAPRDKAVRVPPH